MKAYHFVGKTLRDGRPVPPDNVTLEHKGPVVCCESGLHASVHPFDALRYAPGSTLCLVDVDGVEDEQDDKVAARRRTILARIDAAPLLQQFAREQALSVLHLWNAPSIVREYLETGDENKRAEAEAAAKAVAATWAAKAAAKAAATMWAAAVAATWAARATWAAAEAAKAAAWAAKAAEAEAEAATWAVAATWASKAEAKAAAVEQQRARLLQLVEEAFASIE